MAPEMQQSEYPYFVRIETSTGKSATVAVAFLTPKQVEHLFQTDFQRLVQEAGVQGARIHVERAATADYGIVLRDLAACLRSANARAA